MTDEFQNPYLDPDAPDAATGAVVAGGTLTGFIKTGQIIAFALAMGLVMMTLVLGYITFSSTGEEQPISVLPGPDDDWILPGVGIVAFLGSAMGAIVVPPTIRRSAAASFAAKGERVDLHTGAEVKITPGLQMLLGGYFSAMLIGQALLEGAATANLILMVLDEQLLHIGIAAICLVGMLMQFPTRDKIIGMIENAQRPGG